MQVVPSHLHSIASKNPRQDTGARSSSHFLFQRYEMRQSSKYFHCSGMGLCSCFKNTSPEGWRRENVLRSNVFTTGQKVSRSGERPVRLDTAHGCSCLASSSFFPPPTAILWAMGPFCSLDSSASVPGMPEIVAWLRLTCSVPGSWLPVNLKDATFVCGGMTDIVFESLALSPRELIAWGFPTC